MTASFYPNPTTNDPREAVLDRLEKAYEHWTEEERRLQGEGRLHASRGRAPGDAVRGAGARCRGHEPEAGAAGVIVITVAAAWIAIVVAWTALLSLWVLNRRRVQRLDSLAESLEGLLGMLQAIPDKSPELQEEVDLFETLIGRVGSPKPERLT